MSNIVRSVKSSGAQSSSPSNQPRTSSTSRPPNGQILKAPANLLRRPANLRSRSPSSSNRPDSSPRTQNQFTLSQYAADAIRANRRGQGPGAAGRRRSQTPRRERDEDEEEGDSASTEADILDLLGENPPKHENKPYTPIPIELEHLKESWPALPLNSTTKSANPNISAVTSQLDWLARRFPSGFTTHHELALRLLKNELVSFSSETEKETVIALAKKMAAQHAEQKTEEEGKVFDPKPVDFEGLPEEQGKDIMDVYMRGQYKMVEEQRIPLLDQVARQLWNNASFQDEQSKRVLGKIEALIPQQQKQQGQKQAAGKVGSGSGAKSQKGGKKTQKVTA